MSHHTVKLVICMNSPVLSVSHRLFEELLCEHGLFLFIFLECFII